MGVFVIIGVVVIVYQVIKTICEKELPAEYHGNWKLEQEDADKVRFGEMSRSQFIRNMNSGKYYAPINQNRFDITSFRSYLNGRARESVHSMKCTWGNHGEYEFIKRMTVEEARALEKAAWADEDLDMFYGKSADIERFLRKK